MIEQIDASKRIVRNGTPEYSRSLEGVIGETLDSVAHRLANAAGSVGARRGQQQTLALDQTRDLVRDLESLRDRTPAAADQGTQSGQPRQREQSQQGRGQPGQGQPGGQAGQRGQPEPGQGGGQAGQGQRGGQPAGQGQSGHGSGQGSPAATGGSGVANGAPFAGGIGDRRQFRREVGARRDAATALRRDLAAQGVDVAPLDRVIDQLSTAGRHQPGPQRRAAGGDRWWTQGLRIQCLAEVQRRRRQQASARRRCPGSAAIPGNGRGVLPRASAKGAEIE